MRIPMPSWSLLYFLFTIGALGGSIRARAGDIAPAPEPIPTIVAQVARVVDGDTLEVVAYPWPAWSTRTFVRISGIDAPESYQPDCDEEKALGQKASMVLSLAIGERSVVYLQRFGRDKYGRLLADVILPDGRSLATLLLEQDLARPYDGKGPRPEWCVPETGKTGPKSGTEDE